MACRDKVGIDLRIKRLSKFGAVLNLTARREGVVQRDGVVQRQSGDGLPRFLNCYQIEMWSASRSGSFTLGKTRPGLHVM
jgi:hypothetical protein